MGYYKHRIYPPANKIQWFSWPNYIEASDDLGKTDEKMKIKISRRESKESIHWLDLILTYGNTDLEKEKIELIDEAEQIRKILSAILNKL